MKKSLIICLTIICVFICSNCSGSSRTHQITSEVSELEKSKTRGLNEPQKVYIEETGTTLPENINLPIECVTNLREFISYIFSNSPNLFYNEEAQRKWLSNYLRRAAANHLKVYQIQNKVMQFPTFPDNSTFVGAWDYPTTYSIVDLRREEDSVIVDIIYKWGAGTNYEGDSRLVSYKFVSEDGTWKIQDIYHYKSKDEFNSAYSLSDELWSYTYK